MSSAIAIAIEIVLKMQNNDHERHEGLKIPKD